METGYWTRVEQEQYVQRMEDEHHRQNRRIEILEQNYEQLTELTMCVREQTININKMSEEIKSQGDKISSIINEPIRQKQRIKEKALDTVVGAITGALIIAIISILYKYM